MYNLQNLKIQFNEVARRRLFLKKKKKEEEEAIGNLKLKKIVAGMKFLLGGLNSRFEMAKESLNLKVQSSRNYAIQIKKKK